jgi:copper chaperone CopZ
MKTETIYLANIKCTGCATTINNELLKIAGVKAVEVINEEDKVILTYGLDNRNEIIKNLHDLGYPEATEENGLLLQIKSYASCMIGRISNLTKENV